MFDQIYVIIGGDRFGAQSMKELAESRYQVQSATPLDEDSWREADRRFEKFPVEEMRAVSVASNPSAIVISGVRAGGESPATNALLAGVATPDMFRHVEAVLHAALSADDGGPPAH